MKDASGHARRERRTRAEAGGTRLRSARRARRLEVSRTSWFGSAAGAVGGALLKGLLVPALAKLVSRIPFGCLAKLCRAFWQRLGGDANAQS